MRARVEKILSDAPEDVARRVRSRVERLLSSAPEDLAATLASYEKAGDGDFAELDRDSIMRTALLAAAHDSAMRKVIADGGPVVEEEVRSVDGIPLGKRKRISVEAEYVLKTAPILGIDARSQGLTRAGRAETSRDDALAAALNRQAEVQAKLAAFKVGAIDAELVEYEGEAEGGGDAEETEA